MPQKGNPLHYALRRSLEQLPPELLASLNLQIDHIIASTPRTFSIYEPLLLLPAHTFASQPWTALLASLKPEDKQTFYSDLALRMKVTHIALNAPITLTKPDETNEENVQRRPNITPLHGSFGPFITHAPSSKDFKDAFWVSTTQNGITQVWAPQYTMFSRGNITEKARILSLPSVKEAVEQGKESGMGCTAVDLYAGIGYFAFSYVKAGMGKVVGFEINAWSVEGLRRGAVANRWSCKVVKDDEVDFDGQGEGLAGDARLLIHQMSNAHATCIVERSRDKLPPVRHVNLGLLPTSRNAYEVAVRCLDPELGGWLHIHENFAVKEISERTALVTKEIENLAKRIKGGTWTARLEHVERVKTYAPGVMHCVLDILLQPPTIQSVDDLQDSAGG